MLSKMRQILARHTIRHYEREGILFCTTDTKEKGLELVKHILYEIVDPKTVLYASADASLKQLYKELADEELFIPGVLGLAHEQFGQPHHQKSAGKIVYDSGLMQYLAMRDIRYYPMLKGLSLEETAQEYDELVRSLQTVYQNIVGMLTIGIDGRTAGILPRKNVSSKSVTQQYAADNRRNPYFDPNGKYTLVDWTKSTDDPSEEHVTLTYLGLSLLDTILIPLLGEESEAIADQLFESESDETFPARFYTRPEIAKKTVIITSQPV